MEQLLSVRKPQHGAISDFKNDSIVNPEALEEPNIKKLQLAKLPNDVDPKMLSTFPPLYLQCYEVYLTSVFYSRKTGNFNFKMSDETKSKFSTDPDEVEYKIKNPLMV